LTAERLDEGPRRKHRDLPLGALLEKFDKLCVRHRNLGRTYLGEGFYHEDDPGGLPTTFLSGPATEEEIAQLERRAREYGYDDGLPDEYKAFLRTTTGISHRDRNMLASVHKVEFWNDKCKLCLLPNSALGRAISPELWPSIGPTINIGEGGDEGSTKLIRPAAFQEAKDVLEQIYAKASPQDRRRIERTARDVYGGVEELREMKGLIIHWYHWDVEAEPFTELMLIVEAAVLEHERGEANYGIPDYAGNNPADTKAEDTQRHEQRSADDIYERERGALGA